MQQLLLLVASAVLFAVGGLFMKYSEGMTRLIPAVVVLMLFCVGATLQAIAMKRAQMSVIYVFVLGLEAVAAFLLGIGFLGERLSLGKACAILLILTGLVLLERA